MSQLPCFCGIVVLRNTLSLLALKTLSNMTHSLWGQILQQSRNSVPYPLAEGVAGVWAHLLGAVLGLGAPLHLHCSFHCHVVGGPAAVPFSLVVAAVARHEALHILPGALFEAFPCSSSALLIIGCCFSERLGSEETTKPHVPWVMPSSHVDCSTGGLALEIYALSSLWRSFK